MSFVTHLLRARTTRKQQVPLGKSEFHEGEVYVGSNVVQEAEECRDRSNDDRCTSI